MIEKLEEKNKKELLSRNYVGHLAFTDQGYPYIVPITYYYDTESGHIISYSSEGHKVTSMRKNKYVAFSVDEIVSVSNWRSILIHGEFEEVSGSAAKLLLHKFAEGVKAVILKKEHQQTQFISEFSSKLQSEGSPLVFQIRIVDITGRTRIH
jgi:nitroimidazol reductase NimA-like FMN-containing flavoprotein (pyridoxamine 5'-phosphate oxidase superfamily)